MFIAGVHIVRCVCIQCASIADVHTSTVSTHREPLFCCVSTMVVHIENLCLSSADVHTQEMWST